MWLYSLTFYLYVYRGEYESNLQRGELRYRDEYKSEEVPTNSISTLATT